MRRNLSAQSLKSDSDVEDFYDNNNDDETIFTADATSSGEQSDLEKDNSASRPSNTNDEGTSLLSHRRVATYGRTSLKPNDKLEEEHESQSLPNVIYASPIRPPLPSPSASNSRLQGTTPTLLRNQE